MRAGHGSGAAAMIFLAAGGVPVIECAPADTQ
jgi:hypothetical protein